MSEPVRGAPSGSTVGRFAAQLVAMVGIAVGTNWILEGRHRAAVEQADALREEVATARFERDRMSRLNHELARELNEASIAAEVARWQLRYTEERLRRTEAESRQGLVSPARPSQERAAARAGAQRPSRPLPARGAIEPLDAVAEAHLAERIHRLAEGGTGASGPSGEVPPLATEEGASTALDLDPLLGVEIAALAPADPSGRGAAVSEWRAVLAETLAAECGSRSGARAHACRNDLERRLFPYGERAVRCPLSGNAEPDYVSVSDVERLPTHSVPLKRGALILCDGALEHL